MRKQRFSRRISISLLSLILVILVFQGLIPISNWDQTNNPQTTPDSPLEASFHDSLTGVGYGLNYTEWANRTDTSSLALLYNGATFGSGSAITNLATNWKGYKLEIRVYELTQNRTYIDNYNFGNGETSWTEVEVDTGFDNIQTSGAGDDIFVQSGTGPDGSACAYVDQDGVLNTGYYRFNQDDRAAFRQTITPQGGSVVWAGLDFDYRGDCAWTSSMFHAYMRVGSTEVWTMTYGPLSNPGGWNHQSMVSLDTAPFTSPVDIEIGLQSDATVGYSTQPNPQFRFDNVRLYVMTLVLPTTVNLRMNTIAVINNGVGNGYVTQNPGTWWQTSPAATFTWTTTPNPPVPNLPVIIKFKVDANLYALKAGNLLSDLSPGAYGTRYTITEGANTSWQMYSLIATPNGYWNHYLNFTKPVDWDCDGLYQPQNPTVNIINSAIAGKTGQTYVRINLTDITSSPAGYWRITAKSPNYVTEVTPTSAGTPQSNFRIGETLRVRSTVTNAPTGYANLSIYNPLGALWRTEVLKPATNQFNFADISLVGATTPAGQYETIVWWNNRTALGASNSREAGLKQAFFTVTHATQLQSYDIATIQTSMFRDVLYNETFVLKAKYTDTDDGSGIEQASVKIQWIDGVNYTLTGLGGGFYQIDSLNTAQTPGVYSLTLYASKNYFDSATKQITVELAHHTSLTPNSTSVTVDWGEMVALQFYYNDTDINAGITGASVGVSSGWQTGSWANTSMGSGNYRIAFTTTWTIPNTRYEVVVSADLANYQLKTRQVTIFVKARSSELSSLPPPAVPIKDAVNITINFMDLVNNTGISNSTNQLHLTVNASLNAYSRIYTISPGLYRLEINTSAPIFTVPKTYTISLAANWLGQPYYANQSISIKLTVRQISTSLTYEPPGDIPYGNIVNLVVHYKVSDTESKFFGVGITGAKINITSPGYTYGLNYTVAAHATIQGDYIITIYNNTLKSIAIYSISIKASGLINYANSTLALNINVRKLYTSLVITPVGNVPYGNSVNISLQVSYSDSVSQWYNGRPLTGLAAGNFGITGGHLFNLYNLGNGNYILEVRNGTVLSFGNYKEYINLLEGGIYLSDNRSVSWTIRKLVSTIIIDPITDIPYGNKAIAIIHATYDDAASKWWNGKGITGLGTTDFTLSGAHIYSITDLTNGIYRLTIENGTILTIQAYTETLTLNEGSIFQSDSTPVNFNVRSLYTELVADLVPANPVGEDVTFNVHYKVKDTASLYYNGRGILGARINITTLGYVYGTDYTVTELGNGDYRILIKTAKVANIQTYTIDLKASYNATYNNATTSSAFQVRAISTSFVYTAPSPAPWGTNITIALMFSVEDSLSSQNRNPLPGANLITVNASNPTFLAAWYNLTGGSYQVKLNTASLAMGTYRANITIYKTNYVNRSVIVEFILRGHFTQVSYNIPDPQAWGKNTTMTVFFEDVDFGYSKIRPVLQITVNESQGFAYNWKDNGDGSFTIILDTRNPTLWPVGSHRVQVKIYQFAYQNASTLITITLKTRDTDLIYQTPDITPYLQNSVIKIGYRDLKNSTSPVGINNNTNPQIPGLQTSAGNVSITVTILNSVLSPVAGASFKIYSMLSMAGYGDGWYNVTINTASLGLTGTYYADIVVKWLRGSYYNNQTIRIPFNVRNITALLEYQPPGSTPYVEGGYVSVRLKYSDIDNSLPINNATVAIYYIENPSNTPLSPFTKALGNYSVVAQASGWYLVRIYMGIDKLYEFGSYDFSIRANKTNYDTRSIANITFAIRQGYTQFTSPYAPLSNVINGIVNITINYIDSESGIGIVNKTTGAPVLLSWLWPYNITIHPDVKAIFGWSDALSRWVKSGDITNYPMGDGGRYMMQLNFTPVPVGNWTLLYLNITAGRNVQSQLLNITFIIEPQSSVMGVTFPQPVIWGVESRFNVTYSKIDGSGIPSTILNLWDLDREQYWSATYWSFQSINPAIGLFEVTVNTTLHPPPVGGFFRLRVEASGGAYTPRSLNVFLNVRPIDSQVILTPPAATGWNTLANITVQYYDTYYSRPINDTNIVDSNDVIIRVTNLPLTYWKLYNGPANGYYIIEINTSYWPTLNLIGYSVYVDVKWEGAPYYNNWTAMRVGVPVRARNTELSYTPSLQVPYGENSSVAFVWRDLDAISNPGISNTSQKVIFELRDWLNRHWNSSGFAWIKDLGNGQYELRINSSKLLSEGSFSFTAYFSWVGQPYYNNLSTTFNINVRQINTILIYSIPAPVPWGNPFQITLQLNVSDASSSLNGRYISGAKLNITAISDSIGPLAPFTYGINYTVVDNGFGRYTLTILNTSLKIDSYSLTVLASRYHINTIYRNASAAFGFTVRALTTTLTYTSPIPAPWGNQVNVSLNYKVSDSASLYWNGRSLTVGVWSLTNGTVWTQGVQYSVLGSAGAYTIRIDNQSVYGSNIGTFVFDITAGAGNNRFLDSTLTNLPFTIRALTTAITYLPSTTQPFGNNVTYFINFNVTDPSSLYYNGDGVNINSWALSNSSGSWAIGNQYIISGGNGVYSLTILRKVYGNIGTFTFNIQVDAGNVRYETASFNNIPFTIRALTTALTYIPATSEPYGNNVTIRVFYNVSDPASVLYNGLGLDVTTWSLSNASGAWTTGNQYIVSGGSGVYTLTILRKVYSAIGISTFNIQVNAGIGQYEPASFNNIPFTIRALTTALTYVPVTPQPFGNNVTIRVFYNVSDPASVLYNGLALSVNTWSLSNSSGSWTAGSQYTVTVGSGFYDLNILSIVYRNIGTFYFNVQVTPPDSRYSSASLNNVIFTIRALSTSLSIIPASPVPFGNNVTGIRVYYNISDPASPLNGRGLDANFILSNVSGAWSANVQYRVTGGAGVFDFTVLRSVYNTVGSYSFNIIANPTGAVYSSATFNNVPFTIRALTTALTFIPSLPVPFGNPITIQVFINVTDPASVVYNGKGLNVNTWSLSNVSGAWISGREYTMAGSDGAYSLTVLKDVYSAVGSYSFAISADMGNPIYQIATIPTVPFTIRTIITAITYSPVLSQPFGNNVTVLIYINVSDPTSIFNGQGVNAAWTLSNASGSWSSGNQYVFTGTSGAYSFTILNKVYTNIGSYSFNSIGTPSSPQYAVATFNGISFSIRALTTTLTWLPPSTQPWGNPINVTLFYNVSDPSSVLYNGMGLNAAGWTLSNLTRTWTPGYEYVVFGANGAYYITIDNDTVARDVGTYHFNVYVTMGNPCYQSASVAGIPFSIRPLTTRLIYTPVPNIPFGNNVTIIFKYNVSDAASLWYNNRAIPGATLSVIWPTGWNLGVDYTSSGTTGVYTLEISNETVNIIQSYSIDVRAALPGNKYEAATIYGLPFTIRQLLTVMTYDPVKPVPYGNAINVSVHLRVSDPESFYYDGARVLIDSFNILSPGVWNLSVNWTWAGDNGDYIITIFNNSRSDIGSYTIDFEATPQLPVFSQAIFYNIPYTIRQLQTILTYEPIKQIPYGNAVNITLHVRVSDPESFYYNNLGVPIGVLNILSPGVWTLGVNWTWIGNNGDYIVTIFNNSRSNVGSYTIDFEGIPQFPVYTQAVFYNIPYTIRQLQTILIYDSIKQIPYGNDVNITLHVRVSDPESFYHNGLGVPINIFNILSPGLWSLGVNWTWIGNNGDYIVTIFNNSRSDVGSYTIDFEAIPLSPYYSQFVFRNIPYTIRQLQTLMIYDPIKQIPYGNAVNITLHIRVSDSESLYHNGLGVPIGVFNILTPGVWTLGVNWTWIGNNGDYIVTILNNTRNSIGDYTIDFKAIPVSPYYSQFIFNNIPYTIRQLQTIMTYDPIKQIPYGNEVNITLHIRVSDSESLYYNGLGVPINVFNILSPGVWILGGNWSWMGNNGDYIITILNNTRSNIGGYTIDVEAIPLSPYYSQFKFYNIPYTIRKLNTVLIYPTPANSPWGDNATSITLRWQVIDMESIYHNSELIIGGQIQVTNPTNWTYWLHYTSKDLLNGNYLLNISKDIVNKVQTYVINLKIYSLTTNIYANITYIGLPFSVIQVFTSHTTIINSTYYLDAYGGWPWGDAVNLTILYRDLDHSRLVPNSNITVRGDSGTPYKSGNFTINGLATTIAGSQTGIFYLIINGTVAENAIGYNFYITLSHPTGYYLNHTYLFTISFRKSVSQIIPKNPPVFVPWGDNLTIIFTYNNSEAVGFPGIADANVNVTVNIPAANAYFTYYAVPAWGPGAWIIKMNTTWANATWIRQEEITFTMTAVAPGTIIAQSFHTVFIKPLDLDIRIISWDAAIFLEQAHSFNITVELRDRSHFNQTEGNFNLIANNTYWTPTGSMGQYGNIRFTIITREGQFTNYTWYWGDVSVTVIGIGVFRLTFFFNQTPTYPQIQELLDYLVMIEARGDHLAVSSTQVQVDLKIKTHKTAMTFNYAYAENVMTPSFNLAAFPTFVNGSSYVYGDIINIYLYWYDLDSGALNPGISAAVITTNWTDPLYYRVFNSYQLNKQNETYRGIFFIQVDTKLFYDVVGTYTLEVNATLETYQRVYLLTHGYLFFEIQPVPVNLTLREPILSIPYHDNAFIEIRVTNIHEGNAGIFLSSSEINIINIPGPMGGSKWLVGTNPLYGEYTLFFYTTAYELGTYNATVCINKTNHEIIIMNFTFEIREINTQISLQTPQNMSVIYRYTDLIKFLYLDIENYKYHIPIGLIPASPVDPNLNFNITNWYNINGLAYTLKDQVGSGIYKIRINASIDVGVYSVSIFVKLPNYQLANYSMTINITQASSVIIPIDPATIYSSFDIFQFFSTHFSVRYTTEFGENIANASLYIEIRIGGISGELVSTINLKNEGNGIYGVELSTGNLEQGKTYTIIVYANPNDKNYDVMVLMYPNIFTVKPIYEHWAFIVGMVAIAAVAGIVAYRQIKWYLTPYQVKAIVRATKLIKKGKDQAVLPVLKDRDELFRSEFADTWVALDLKPPKLMRPEVVLFASEISAVLRTRMTTPEAETLVNTLKMQTPAEAERQLGEMKIPPEATRRLLTIIGLIKKERADVKNFAEALSQVKGAEIPYIQAEEVFDHLQTLSAHDADKYLEALVIPEVDRKRLLELIEGKSAVAVKKPKEIKEEKVKSKETPAEKVKDKPMTASELRAALDKIAELSPEEKESLIKDLEKLSLDEQKQILKNLQAVK